MRRFVVALGWLVSATDVGRAEHLRLWRRQLLPPQPQHLRADGCFPGQDGRASLMSIGREGLARRLHEPGYCRSPSPVPPEDVLSGMTAASVS